MMDSDDIKAYSSASGFSLSVIDGEHLRELEHH
jgi:hypothetical protein